MNKKRIFMNQKVNWIASCFVALVLAAPHGTWARGAKEGSKVLMPLTSMSDDGSIGSMSFSSSRGKSSLKLQLTGCPPNATLHLVVGGVVRDDFTTDSKGSAKLQFQSGSASGSKQLLDFDPR